MHGSDSTETAAAEIALWFGPQERLKLVPIIILNNAIRQPPRKFKATLSDPVGVPLGATSTTTYWLLQDLVFRSAPP